MLPPADQEAGADELNPFSFREFLRWKNQDPQLTRDPDSAPDRDQDDTQNEVTLSQRHGARRGKHL